MISALRLALLAATLTPALWAQPSLVADLETGPGLYDWRGTAIQWTDDEVFLWTSGYLLWRVPLSSNDDSVSASLLLTSASRAWLDDEAIYAAGRSLETGERGLWRLDGADPVLVLPGLYPQALPSSPEGGPPSGPIVFSGYANGFESGLWSWNPSTGSPVRLLELTLSYDPFRPYPCDELVRLGSIILACANDGVWATDGTLAGTRRLTPPIQEALALRALGNGLAVFTEIYSGNVWVTDGTTTGTRPVGMTGPSYAGGWVVGGDAFAWSDTSGSLWTSDLELTTPRQVGYLGYPLHIGELGLLAHGQPTFQPSEIGSELWRWREADGWTLVADLAPGPASSYVWEVVPWDRGVAFVGTTPEEGAEAWKTDGTPAGTEPLIAPAPGPAGRLARSSGLSLLRSGDLLVPMSARPTVADAIGVPFLLPAVSGSLRALPQLALGSAGSRPQFIGEVEGRAWWLATVAGIRGVWSSDGTAAGTVPIEGAGMLGSCHQWDISRVDEATLVGCDGTVLEVGGTSAVVKGRFSPPAAPIEPWFDPVKASPSPVAQRFVRLGGRLVGFPVAGGGLRTLVEGSSDDSDVMLLPPGSFNGRLIVLGDRAVFGYRDQSGAGSEAWVTDGTVAGTHRLGPELIPGQFGLMFADLRVGDRVLLSSYDGPTWLTDGTADGTVELTGVESTGIRVFADESVGCFFGSVDNVHGLVAFDARGQAVVMQDVPQAAGVLTLEEARTTFYAGDFTTGYSLWETDCTLDGTRQLAQLPPRSVPLTAGRSLWVVGFDSSGQQRHLGRHEPATGKTTWIRSWPAIPGGASATFEGSLEVGDLLFFSAAESATGLEPWVVDTGFLFADGFETGDTTTWVTAPPLTP
jgi:ELWxxDGT repeat protein